MSIYTTASALPRSKSGRNQKQSSPSSWDFELAKETLLAIERYDDITEVDRKDVIVAENVMLDTFVKFSQKDPELPVKICLQDGKILVRELPSQIHGLVAGIVIRKLRPDTDLLLGSTDIDIIVGLRSLYRPDASFKPIGLPIPPLQQACDGAGNAYPTMVVEIGDTQSLNSLHERVYKYFSARTTIQIYLAIKIFPRRHPRGRRPRLNDPFALLALLYQRNNANPTIPTQVISFGTAPIANVTTGFLQNIGAPLPPIGGHNLCTTANMPAFQLQIPSNLLFHGVPGNVLGGLPATFHLDLFLALNVLRNTLPR